MSLFTENLILLANYSKRIDKATANKKDLEELKKAAEVFERQTAAGYYTREKADILKTIAAAHVEEVREVIALNEAIKAAQKEINASRRKEAAAAKAANKADFIAAYVYAYGSTKKAAAEVYKTAGAGYISAIIDGYKQEAKTAFYND